MALHRIYFEGDLRPGALSIGGDEAHHAVRVKRLAIGDRVQVLNGRGRIANAVIVGTGKDGHTWTLRLEVASVDLAPPTTPRLEVCSPAPKGQRLAEMIDALSQVGAAVWSYLETQHSDAEPRPAKMDRLARIAAEASKQCGRAWLLQIGPALSFPQALAGDAAVVLADASGEPYRAAQTPAIRLLVGPEGGWSPRELQQARAAGLRIARFGPHTMRIETAAPVAAAIILDAESRAQGPRNL